MSIVPKQLLADLHAAMGSGLSQRAALPAVWVANRNAVLADERFMAKCFRAYMTTVSAAHSRMVRMRAERRALRAEVEAVRKRLETPVCETCGETYVWWWVPNEYGRGMCRSCADTQATARSRTWADIEADQALAKEARKAAHIQEHSAEVPSRDCLLKECRTWCREKDARADAEHLMRHPDRWAHTPEVWECRHCDVDRLHEDSWRYMGWALDHFKIQTQQETIRELLSQNVPTRRGAILLAAAVAEDCNEAVELLGKQAKGTLYTRSQMKRYAQVLSGLGIVRESGRTAAEAGEELLGATKEKAA